MVFTETGDGMPVSGPILTAKAKILYEKLYGNSHTVTDTSDTSETVKARVLRAVLGLLRSSRLGMVSTNFLCRESLSASSGDVEPFR